MDAFHFHDFLLGLVAFTSEFLGTLSGFGSSTFFVPVGLLLENFKFVLVLTSLLHCFGNIIRIVLFRKSFSKKTFFTFFISSVVFTGVGALLTLIIKPDWLIKLLGVSLIFISLTLFSNRLKKLKAKMPFAVFLSSCSGFFTGLVGTGGALRGAALSTLSLSKDTFIVTSASIDLGGDLLRAFIYLKNGYMDWSQSFYIPILLGAAYIGSQFGKIIITRIDQNQFEKLVSIFIFISGAVLIL
ncbi:MAG: sulfite exporter TauE/SafE family protein [Bdellovibrionales bacterium]|nr:sulfite exporter TauE/SafE family protein [Bdellovibrionales bacterium]